MRERESETAPSPNLNLLSVCAWVLPFEEDNNKSKKNYVLGWSLTSVFLAASNLLHYLHRISTERNNVEAILLEIII